MYRKYVNIDLLHKCKTSVHTIMSMDLIPNPHSSGYWKDGFDFTNDNLYQVVLL